MTEPTTEYRATDAEVYLDYEGRAQLVLFTGKGAVAKGVGIEQAYSPAG